MRRTADIFHDVDGLAVWRGAHNPTTGESILPEDLFHASSFESLLLDFPVDGATPAGKKASSVRGEEFVVLLPDTPAEGAQQVAERIREAVHSRKIVHKGSAVSEYVTISVGVAGTLPSQQHSAEEVIHLADEAMYKSKKQGRNRVTLTRLPGGAQPSRSVE